MKRKIWPRELRKLSICLKNVVTVTKVDPIINHTFIISIYKIISMNQSNLFQCSMKKEGYFGISLGSVFHR